MQEQITKHSPILGKDAVYTKTVSYLKCINLILLFSMLVMLAIFPFSQKSIDCQHI